MTELGTCTPLGPIERKGKKRKQMNDVGALRMRRRLERRELQVYSTVGFLIFLPVVVVGRCVSLLRGGGERRGSVIEETKAKVGGLLGFVFMA